VWMHNGFLQVEGRKMAKSEGNFVTIRELLKGWSGYAWPGEALRYNLLRTHYRQPLDWTYQGLEESHKELWDWYKNLKNTQPARTVPQAILDSMCDDLNTSDVITEMRRLFRNNKYEELLASLNFLGFSGDRNALGRVASIVGDVVGSARVAGVTASSIELGRGKAIARGRPLDIDNLKAARDKARKAKNWAEADRIRDELESMGIEVHDTKGGTTYEEKR
jgi:cysteinyl-tRNA synthetase